MRPSPEHLARVVVASYTPSSTIRLLARPHWAMPNGSASPQQRSGGARLARR